MTEAAPEEHSDPVLRVRLSAIDGLVTALDGFVDVVLADSPQSAGSLARARMHALSFDTPDYMDLGAGSLGGIARVVLPLVLTFRKPIPVALAPHKAEIAKPGPIAVAR